MQSWLVWLGVCFGPILAVYPTQTEMPFRQSAQVASSMRTGVVVKLADEWAGQEALLMSVLAGSLADKCVGRKPR